MSNYDQSYDHLDISLGSDEQKHILWLTLNNPEASNAISKEMIESLVHVLDQADNDAQVRVIVLTGAGKCFCAGGDIKAMENKEGMFAGEPNQLRNLYRQGIQKIPKAMEALQTPIIAMVNGAAVGAGCDLTAMCDIRIASRKAKFAETFSKLSLVPGDGGTFFLQRIVGHAKAMEMFLTGNMYSAEEALSMGLVNFLHTPEQLREETCKIAVKISNNGPIAIGMTKKALKAGHKADLNSHLDLLAAYQGIVQRTEDHFEAIQAFKEKRLPSFEGR